MNGKSSLDAVFAKRGLWDRLWLAAIDEAYMSRDGQRSMIELQGQTKDEIVAAYLGSHLDIGEWVRGHVDAGTCDVAELELRGGMERIGAFRRSKSASADTTASTPENKVEPIHNVALPLTPVRRKTGPQSDKTGKAARKMVDDIRSGAKTWADLDSIKYEALAAEYGVASTDTVRKALAKAKAELDAIPKSAK